MRRSLRSVLCLTAEAEAQFEEGQYGTVYYVNPVMVVEQWTSGSRSFRKRFKLTERDRLISIAAHEFVHGGCGYDTMTSRLPESRRT